VLYWGSSTATKQSPTPIATILKTGSNLTYALPEDTAIPVGATHLLVFAKNSAGESSASVNTLLGDTTGDAKLRIEINSKAIGADATPTLVVTAGSIGDSIAIYDGPTCNTLIETKVKSDVTTRFDVSLGLKGNYTFSTQNITTATCSPQTVSYTYLGGFLPITTIASAGTAFAALRSDGSVITWGLGIFGGDSSSVSSALDGSISVSSIYATDRAFAALRSDGSVITWGSSIDGGDSSSVSSALDGSISVSTIYATDSAFAALRSDGSVITWGLGSYGGDSAAVADFLNSSIVEISSTNNSFAAITQSGAVVVWGAIPYQSLFIRPE